MHITLVRPPFYSLFGYQEFAEPLSLLYLGAVLQENSYEVNIIDGELTGRKCARAKFELPPRVYANVRAFYTLFSNQPRMMPGYSDKKYNEIMENKESFVWKEIISLIRKSHPDLVGFTTYTASMTGIQYLCSLVKKELDVPIVLGGIHVTALPERSLQETNADVAVIGEGEKTIVDLVNAFDRGQSVNQFSSIPGIAFRVKSSVHITKARPLIDNLERLPFPARDLLSKENGEIYMDRIISSRGCPFNCIFCASKVLWTRRVRFRTPENVVREILELCEKYKIRRFVFSDDTFTLSKKHVLEICKRIEQLGIDVEFSCSSRADTLDLEIAKALKKAGCIKVTLGIESGNQQILDLIKKGITKEEAIKGVTVLKKVGLPFTTFFMLGHPTETKETIQDTIEFMKQLDPDYAEINIVSPYPGTDLWNIFQKRHQIKDIKWYKFFHQSLGVTSSDNLSRQEISDEFIKAYKIFSTFVFKKRIRAAPAILLNKLKQNARARMRLLFNAT